MERERAAVPPEVCMLSTIGQDKDGTGIALPHEGVLNFV